MQRANNSDARVSGRIFALGGPILFW